MADLGTHGVMPSHPTTGVLLWPRGREGQPGYIRRMVIPGTPHSTLQAGGTRFNPVQSRNGLGGVSFAYGDFGGIRIDVGNPSQPSQMQNAPGRILTLVPVLSAGAKTVTIDVRYWPNAAPRPRLVCKRDLNVGVQDDIVADADAGEGFVTITLNVTVAQAGVLTLYREQVNQRQDAWTIWDNLISL